MRFYDLETLVIKPWKNDHFQTMLSFLEKIITKYYIAILETKTTI